MGEGAALESKVGTLRFLQEDRGDLTADNTDKRG